MFENKDGEVTMRVQDGAQCYVNGRAITEPTVLRTGARLIVGKHHVFRFNHPEQARESRAEKKTPTADSPGSGTKRFIYLCPFVPLSCVYYFCSVIKYSFMVISFKSCDLVNIHTYTHIDR